MKTLSVKVFNSAQSWNYVDVFKLDNGIVARVRIRRNAYDDQSFLAGEMLTPEGWTQITYAPMDRGCQCYDLSYVQNNVTEKDFATDAARVVLELTTILDSVEFSGR